MSDAAAADTAAIYERASRFQVYDLPNFEDEQELRELCQRDIPALLAELSALRAARDETGKQSLGATATQSPVMEDAELVDAFKLVWNSILDLEGHEPGSLPDTRAAADLLGKAAGRAKRAEAGLTGAYAELKRVEEMRAAAEIAVHKLRSGGAYADLKAALESSEAALTEARADAKEKGHLEEQLGRALTGWVNAEAQLKEARAEEARAWEAARSSAADAVHFEAAEEATRAALEQAQAALREVVRLDESGWTIDLHKVGNVARAALAGQTTDTAAETGTATDGGSAASRSGGET